METALEQPGLKPPELRTLYAGFLLVGLAVAVTAASYVLNMTFSIQWLVWVIGFAFAAVALLSLEWPRGFRARGHAPEGKLRLFLLVSMPLAYVLGSQICGTGLKACGPLCHATSLAAIGLAGATAFRLHRGQSISLFLIPLIAVSLIPHCTCPAPINVLWHGMLGGVAPTCGLVPLAAVLFSVSALRGVRTPSSATLATVLLAMIVFIAVGNPLIGFPWEGCV